MKAKFFQQSFERSHPSYIDKRLRENHQAISNLYQISKKLQSRSLDKYKKVRLEKIDRFFVTKPRKSFKDFRKPVIKKIKKRNINIDTKSLSPQRPKKPEKLQILTLQEL